MATKQAKLTILTFAQDFQSGHWNWTDGEKKKLGDVEEMGKIIKSRLENAGCEIQEMYAVKHDKDEKRWWNEYKKDYEVQFKSNHAHFVIKFKKGKGKTLPELAREIGIEENYIEKPKSGSHSYDNMLSYLIHIKYESKYQYDVNAVYTITGKKYIEYYREKYESWTKGRAEISVKSAKELINFLKMGILNGEIEKKDIAQNDEWLFAYALNTDLLDKAFEGRNVITGLKRRYPQE